MRDFYKKTANKTVFAILVLIFVCFVSCEESFGGELAYLDSPFSAHFEGEVDGERVVATVFCDPTEHKTKEIYNKLTMTFSSPESLEGITVSLRSDGKGTVRLKGSEEELPLYSGMVEPYLALCNGMQVNSQRKTAEGYEVVLREGDDSITLVMDKTGIPKSAEGRIKGRKIFLKITNFKQT